MSIKWNKNGNWLLTASRDHLIKLFDIRMMKELQTFRGHKREATSKLIFEFKQTGTSKNSFQYCKNER